MSAGRANEEKTARWKEEEAAREVARKNLEHGRELDAETNITLLIEEMSELTKALCKARRFDLEDPTLAIDEDEIIVNIIEELADVTLMIDRIIYVMGVGRDVMMTRAEKVERTEMRLKE